MAEATGPTTRSAVRPEPISGADAGAAERSGWIAPDGKFYPAARWTHLRVAEELRTTGDGPADPWTMADGWVLVRAHGETVCLPSITQAQWDTLGDMVVSAPAGAYRSSLLQSVRELRELDAHTVPGFRAHQ